jgi:hypothetical protein
MIRSGLTSFTSGYSNNVPSISGHTAHRRTPCQLLFGEWSPWRQKAMIYRSLHNLRSSPGFHAGLRGTLNGETALTMIIVTGLFGPL